MFFKVRKLLTYNFKTLVKFELIYKLLSVFILKPVFSSSFRLIMKVNGFKYIIFENIFDFISKPSTIFLTLLYLFLIMIYTFFEIINIIVILDASKQRIKIDVRDSFIISVKKCFKLFRLSNIGLIIFVLFIIPFLNLGISTSFMSVINVPEYIMDFIKSNILYLSIYIILMIILYYTLFRWIYSLNFMVLENVNFNKAKKLSKTLTKNTSIKDFIKILIIEGMQYLSYLLFIGFGIFLIILSNKLINGYLIVNSILTTVIWIFLALSFIIFNLITVPISYAAITHLYYEHKEKKNEEIKHITITKENREENIIKTKSKFHFVKYILILIVLLMGTIYTYGINKGRFNLNITKTNNIAVTAHRGASKKYPENTMLAFKKAKKLGADWIELDVQATKDNKIIVIHDSNLKRVANINKNVWELNYNEISKLDVGSHLNKKYKGEKIPTLTEVIDWAIENDVKLNIEIKPTGHEENIEKDVVDIISEKEFINKCVVTSGKYNTIRKVKEYNKNIKTIYVMSLAYGDILEFNDVDGFSLESSNINEKLVNKIHKNKKEIYAWTVNNEKNINKMIKLGVDNIVTDDISYTKKLIEESKSSNIIMEYINFIDELF